VRRHEINRESRDLHQHKGESLILYMYCDRSADYLSNVEAVGGSNEQFADDSLSDCQNRSVPRKCHDGPTLQMTMALKHYYLKCDSAVAVVLRVALRALKSTLCIYVT
jgi:hypothetical protein